MNTESEIQPNVSTKLKMDRLLVPIACYAWGMFPYCSLTTLTPKQTGVAPRFTSTTQKWVCGSLGSGEKLQARITHQSKMGAHIKHPLYSTKGISSLQCVHIYLIILFLTMFL